MSHAEWVLNSLPLAGNENILDVGCGNGKLTARLAQKVPDGIVIGIDPSDSMLAGVLQMQASTRNLTFLKASAESFSLPYQFDHVIAIHVMHWIQEQEKALANIFAHLKPNGKVHIILAPSKEGLPFYTALKNTMHEWKDDFTGFVNPQQTFDLETYRTLMVRAGFHIDSIHYVYHKSMHENRDALQQWIKQWLPHRKHLPPEKQNAFLDSLMQYYLAAMNIDPQQNSPIPWGEYVLIVHGTKPAPTGKIPG
ncbi:MAG: hypothetical protein A3F09_05900 [Chlamydiae bacterium RIFCSPHIGHO2_12_FULL_49_11]|nr:MAG: hypothetical protein A3F09_05900 [Chlamydiae bacterium RIFCSPHIGHO2_12_FULL_49_11]